MQKGINIFHPYQWEAVLQFASKPSPYHVRVMRQTEFLDYKTNLGSIYSMLINQKVTDLNEKRIKIKWSQLRHVSLEKTLM